MRDFPAQCSDAVLNSTVGLNRGLERRWYLVEIELCLSSIGATCKLAVKLELVYSCSLILISATVAAAWSGAGLAGEPAQAGTIIA